jgi:hypothetical protein
MLRAILGLHDASAEALARGAPLAAVLSLPERARLAGIKDLPEDRLGEIDAAGAAAREACAKLGAADGAGDGR